jgi:lactate dehydrogenase-like 2-hydroxyacid dehydrogenase
VEKRRLILIPDRSIEANVETVIFGKGYKILTPHATRTADIEDDIWHAADGILAWHELMFDRNLLSKLINCKVIVRIGVGFDNIDIAAAKDLRIPVCIVPDYGVEDVADHTLAIALNLLRGISGYDQSARSGDWSWNSMPALRRIRGQKLGIVGLGRIGTAVANRAKVFGFDVGFFDPYKFDGWDKALGVRRFGRLQDLLKCSDVISLHTPLTEETANMVNSEFISSTKRGAVLINTARGGLMNLQAVWHGLEMKHLGGVGLDVLPIEPPDRNEPLVHAWQANDGRFLGKIIVTPHSAFFNHESYEEMRKKAAITAVDVLERGEIRNCVNNFIK